MRLIVNGEDVKSLKGFAYCDTDFLSIISQDEELAGQVFGLFSEKLLLDPLTELEFLRDVFAPKHRSLKENIIANGFIKAENSQEILIKTLENALTLSRIYGHQNKGVGASMVDLLLAGRMMTLRYSAFLVTGNAKDFPSIVFDTVAILNFEQNDGAMRSISVLKFNKEKFKECEKKYSKIGS
jgi:hypothetical protein